MSAPTRFLSSKVGVYLANESGVDSVSSEKARIMRTDGAPVDNARSTSYEPDTVETLPLSSLMLRGSVMSKTRICGFVKPVM